MERSAKFEIDSGESARLQICAVLFSFLSSPVFGDAFGQGGTHVGEECICRRDAIPNQVSAFMRLQAGGCNVDPYT